MPDTIQLDSLVATYIKIRDKRDVVNQEAEAKLKKLDDQLDALKRALLDHCRENSVESGRTTAGTFTRTLKSRYWTNDWAAMHKFIIENEVPELLEKRIQQSNIKQFLEEHPEVTPPGLNVESEYTITVRRATK